MKESKAKQNSRWGGVGGGKVVQGRIGRKNTEEKMPKLHGVIFLYKEWNIIWGRIFMMAIWISLNKLDTKNLIITTTIIIVNQKPIQLVRRWRL